MSKGKKKKSGQPAKLEVPELPELPESEPAPVEVTSAKAKELLKKEVENITKKVEMGKTMTEAERAILQAVAAGEMASTAAATIKAFAKNQTELATILGVKRRTINRWRKESGNPGAESNGNWNVAAWKEFARKKGHKLADDENDSPSATMAKAEQTLIQNERLKLKLMTEKGLLIPKLMAQQVFTKLIITAKNRSYSSILRFVTLARMAENNPAASDAVKAEMDAIWQSLTDSKWLKE